MVWHEKSTIGRSEHAACARRNNCWDRRSNLLTEGTNILLARLKRDNAACDKHTSSICWIHTPLATNRLQLCSFVVDPRHKHPRHLQLNIGLYLCQPKTQLWDLLWNGLVHTHSFGMCFQKMMKDQRQSSEMCLRIRSVWKSIETLSPPDLKEVTSTTSV